MTTPLPAPGPANWARIMVLGMVWGSAFIAMAVALEGLTPLWVAAGRCAIAALALVALSPLWGKPFWRALPAMSGRAVLFMGLVGAGATALPLALLGWGLQ